VNAPHDDGVAPVASAENGLQGSEIERALGLVRVMAFGAMLLEHGSDVRGPEQILGLRRAGGGEEREQQGQDRANPGKRPPAGLHRASRRDSAREKAHAIRLLDQAQSMTKPLRLAINRNTDAACKTRPLAAGRS